MKMQQIGTKAIPKPKPKKGPPGLAFPFPICATPGGHRGIQPHHRPENGILNPANALYY